MYTISVLSQIQGELERQKSTLRDQKQRHNILYKQARKLMEEKNELTNQLRQTTLAGIALEQQLHTAGIPVAVKVPITSLDTSLKPPFPPLAATTSSPLPQVKQEDAKQNVSTITICTNRRGLFSEHKLFFEEAKYQEYQLISHD